MRDCEGTTGWVERVRAGDRLALGRLVQAWDPRIQALAHRLLGDRHEAEDVRQAAWVRAIEGLGELSDPASFRTWLFRVVVNLCRDRVRRARWTRVAPPEEPGELPVGGGPEADAEDAELRESVAAAVRALPEDERECLVLRHWHEMSVTQIAAVVGRPRTTVHSSLERALSRLRLSLAPAVVDDEGARGDAALEERTLRTRS